MTILRTLAVTAALLAPSGCGITYISTRVSDEAEGMDVRVVPITPEMVLIANSQPYAPRSLPAAFYQTAGMGSPRGTGTLPEPPAFPQLAPQPLDLRPPPRVEPGPYRLGTGDVLRLVVAAGQQIDPLTGATEGTTTMQELTIRDDGAVSMPQVGPVDMAGLTVEEAENRLFSRMIDAGLDPNFSLEISGYNSQRAAVGGAVGSPRTVALTLNPPTLNEALTAAGGITARDAEFASIRIYRQGELYQIPLDDFRARPDLQGLPVLAGDAIYVDTTYDLDRAQTFYQRQLDVIALQRTNRQAALSEMQTEMNLRRSVLGEQRDNFRTLSDLGAVERDYVYLAGEVTRQTRWPLPFGRQATLADALFDTGGFRADTGNPAHIYVLRASTNPAEFGAVTAWHLDGRSAAALTLATRFQMRPDDILFIEQQPVTRWNRAMQQTIPSFINTVVAATDN
ncbi:MAG: polysaccharide biosynthesis/export family protein [Rubellimicrobium sp.]|nr:polysaccharide biosynthesis/export family protein [Rubellimicrobium sp.]